MRDVLLGEHLLQLLELGLDLTALQRLGLIHQLADHLDLGPQRDRVDREHGALDIGQDRLLFFVGQPVEVAG